MKNVAKAFLPTQYGNFQISVYTSADDGEEHVALTLGALQKQPVLVRVHSKCLTGDTFSSLLCDCQEQLHKSLEQITKNGSGILIYLDQEGRGIGLTNKIKAYALQEQGKNTFEANEALDFPADGRYYRAAADILKSLGVTKIELLTNNPQKQLQLEAHGIEVTKRTPLETTPNAFNKAYLSAKKHTMGHQLKNV